MAPARQLNPRLRLLDLSDTNMRSSGVEVLMVQLTSYSALTQLHLTGNNLGVDGATAVARLLRSPLCALTSLDLARTSLIDRTVRPIAEALPHCSTLTHLSLEWNRIHSFKFLAEPLLANCSLRSLHLGGGNVRGDAKAAQLSDVLQRNTTLTHLALEWTALTTEGVRHFAPSLHHNHSLTSLDLRGNAIDEDGVRLLSDALQHNSTLTSLHVAVLAHCPPPLANLIRCMLVCALDRQGPGAARLSLLPSDLLSSVMASLSFVDSRLTRAQLQRLCRSLCTKASEVRTQLCKGRALTLTEAALVAT